MLSFSVPFPQPLQRQWNTKTLQCWTIWSAFPSLPCASSSTSDPFSVEGFFFLAKGNCINCIARLAISPHSNLCVTDSVLTDHRLYRCKFTLQEWKWDWSSHLTLNKREDWFNTLTLNNSILPYCQGRIVQSKDEHKHGNGRKSRMAKLLILDCKYSLALCI